MTLGRGIGASLSPTSLYQKKEEKTKQNNRYLSKMAKGKNKSFIVEQRKQKKRGLPHSTPSLFLFLFIRKKKYEWFFTFQHILDQDRSFSDFLVNGEVFVVRTNQFNRHDLNIIKCVYKEEKK